jgi:hypothetical protein
MIVEKLMKAEYDSERTLREEYKRYKATRSILKLLNMVNFNPEVVPVVDIKRLTRLLVSLKGETLNKEESQLVFEMANN